MLLSNNIYRIPTPSQKLHNKNAFQRRLSFGGRSDVQRSRNREPPPPRRTPSHVATGRWSKARNRHQCRIGKHAPPSSGFRRVFTNARFLSPSAVPATMSHLVIASSWPPRSAALPRRSSFVPTLPVSGSWSGPPQSAAVSFLITLG
uniref:Uncharacterized protein n=1 Tax=Rousettus aegyptiacus TaxID=9407 RepID=A0A7J8FIE5_ROUAE|nr:hypothetical protein HJG63_011837 [Rousettus aegyptiacus]